MNQRHRIIKFLGILVMYAFAGCSQPNVDKAVPTGTSARIYPDYTSLILPLNIAPLNFIIQDNGEEYFVRVQGEKGSAIEVSGDSIITFPQRRWHQMLRNNAGGGINFSVFVKQAGTWHRYEDFTNQISTDSIDSYLSYRLIEPGYEQWDRLGLMQRNLENFDESPIMVNDLTERQCMNCHNFLNNRSDTMMFHIRGAQGGTVIVRGDSMYKADTRTDSTFSAMVYPSWHSTGKWIAFSSNETKQAFYSHDPSKIEVFDLRSDLYLFDVQNNSITPILRTTNAFETQPSWAPDGKKLYYCSAPAPAATKQNTDDERIKNIHLQYNLYSIEFDPSTGTFGKTDTLYKASDHNRSVAFPRVSPNGQFLMATTADYGTFPIWRPSSDLLLIRLSDKSIQPTDVINSNAVDSYHTWSSNSRFVVFSSRRLNGTYTRPYIAHLDAQGVPSKPFIVPQEDPMFYRLLLKSFNVPELTSTPMEIGLRDLESVSNGPARKTKFISR